MLKRLVGAVLVCRLELRQLPVDPQLILALWRQRPAVEIVVAQRLGAAAERLHLLRRLDEVYPF
jgi:hypothetical protein